MKDIKKILLVIICCFLNVSFCYAAAEVNFNFIDPGESDNNGGNNDDDNVDDDVDDGDDGNNLNGSFNMGDGYTCSYVYDLEYSTSVKIDGFNQKNESIVSGEVTPKESVKAGTSIGISIVEKKQITWQYDISVKHETERYHIFRCEDGIKNVALGDTGNYDSYINDLNCSYLGQGGGVTDVSSGSYYARCENEVKSKIEDIANGYVTASSKVRLREPNDINSMVEFEIGATTDVSIEGPKYIAKTYFYSPKYVCLDKKNAEVTYKNAVCNSNEFMVENERVNGVEHFHYFIPMNVMDGSFSLVLGNDEYHNKNWCVRAIDANQYYYDFLFVIVGGKYTKLSDNKAIAKNEVASGCYFRTEMKIPVADGFYRIDTNDELDGFNFYVKAINENDPFPNPIINENSLWYNWYQSNYSSNGEYAYNNMGPNIKASYDEVSYLLRNVNAAEIRNYNSWTSYLNNNLNVNGKSSFINGTLLFDEFDNSYYKVGCGPLNLEFQEGCR